MPDNEFNVNGPELDLTWFESFNGTALHYARAPVALYGSQGKPRKVRLDRQFLAKMNVCLEELWSLCPAGKASVLVSGGCYVEKAGPHGTGRAIDIDAVWWPREADYSPVVTLNYPRDRRRYLAIEAILRKHFGIVLDYHYNSKHRDHFHVDDTEPVGFFATASRIVFIQAALIYVFNIQLDHDGKWGSETAKAVQSVTSQLKSPDDISGLEGWMGFLDAVALTGFGTTETPALEIG